MAPKRKATSPAGPSPLKKQNTGQDSNTDDGIIQRQFYPAEISAARCQSYDNNEIPRPIEELNSAIKDTKDARAKIELGECVVHWFKRDLRTNDNTALSRACTRAKDGGVPLICIFIVSPQDYQAHVTSAARVDFELRTLQVLQKDLHELNIPLYVTTIDKRRDVISHILDKCFEWRAKHLFCNIEYEVDELRRETNLTRMCLEKGIDFTAIHDDVAVPPGSLQSGAGKQYSVYSPWYRAWVRHIHDHPQLLNEQPAITANPSSTKITFKSIFNLPIPSAPPNKTLTDSDRSRLSSYWPPGEHEAQLRLAKFIQQRITDYKTTRNLPFAHSTSTLSVHFSSGTLSVRTAIRAARAANTSRSLDAGKPGIITWISELAWRDFYKHVLCHWPYVCMSKAFKYSAHGITWDHDAEAFQKWCEGRTGFPIVDAAMRQMREMAYMHNRCRMIVASFLAKDLLLDWRLGERFFMESLVDGDFASNSGGWGFSASVGVDPQPYFRIFNPFLQSEKFDPEGEYIRKWVPELREVVGKAIHDPYGRGAGKQAEKAGYPKTMVDHKEARTKALDRYKTGTAAGS